MVERLLVLPEQGVAPADGVERCGGARAVAGSPLESESLLGMGERCLQVAVPLGHPAQLAMAVCAGGDLTGRGEQLHRTLHAPARLFGPAQLGRGPCQTPVDVCLGTGITETLCR
nr:hypothetical protein [Streptomyces luteolifulvus]